MNTLVHKGHAARIEFDAVDRLFASHLAGIDDVVGFHAETFAGIVHAFHEAVDDYPATCERVGKSMNPQGEDVLRSAAEPSTPDRSGLRAEPMPRWSAGRERCRAKRAARLHPASPGPRFHGL